MNRFKLSKKLVMLFMVIAMLISTFPVISWAAENIQAEFYINPVSGNDANNGSKDAPFKTIEGALKTVKLHTKNMTGDIYVYFADGRYELTKPVRLDATCGGSNGYKVYYKAEHGANPVITGSKEITGWELFDEEKNIYRAKTDGLYTRHFVVDGERAIRARSHEGLKKAILDNGKKGLTCENVEMLSWRNPNDIEFVFINSFYCKRIIVSEMIQLSEEKVQFDLMPLWSGKTGTMGWVAPRYVENAFELLDEEGEFYNDRTEKYIYYKPKAGQSMETVKSYIPYLEELFVVSGYNYLARTKDIVFDGLDFSETTWMFPTENGGFRPAQDGYMQAGGNISGTDRRQLINPAAMTIALSSGIEVLNCEFYALGASGIRVLEGSEKIDIIGNHIRDLGGGALFIGSIQINEENPKDTRRVVKDINVKNNYIHHVSQENKNSAAISAGYPYNCTISHNEIHDCPYSGAHIGWGWEAQREKMLINFVFEYNYVHDFLKSEDRMGDGGGIYCNGKTSATIENPNLIRNNYFKDGYAGSIQAGAMIYLDNSSSNWRIEANVVDNIVGSKYWDTKPFAQTNTRPLNDYWIRNYVTMPLTRYSTDTRRNIVYDDNRYHPTANWPEEAREVIRKSGLEPEYQYLSPRSKEFAKIYSEEFVNINVGDTFRLDIFAGTEFCEEIPLNNAEVKFEVADTKVATVDETGLITALAEGQTELTTTVTVDGVTKTAKTTISIGSGLAFIKLQTATPNKFIKGETKQLPVLTGINYGNSEIEGELTNVTFKSSNENVLSVDLKANTMTAKDYGEATLTCYGEFAGVGKTLEHKITVMDYADQSGLNYPATSLSELLEDSESWYVQKGDITEISNGIQFPYTGVAQYTVEQFDDVLFDFYLTAEKKAVWPSIALRNQGQNMAINEENSMYLITFANNGIELQRFNGNDRTSIYCNLLPVSRIGASHSMILQEGKKYHIQVGTFNEEGGVRVILNIDGVNVMNYLDETEGRIENAGYFGFIVNETAWDITTR